MVETTISFDAMPGMLASIMNKLEELEKKLENLQPTTSQTPDTWLSLKDLCQYLPSHPAEQTVYGWTSNHFIPYHKKGKNIVFLKSEIDEWLVGGKRKSLRDIEQEAFAFVNSKKKARL